MHDTAVGIWVSGIVACQLLLGCVRSPQSGRLFQQFLNTLGFGTFGSTGKPQTPTRHQIFSESLHTTDKPPKH